MLFRSPREKTLTIMKDSRVGTFGVLALIIDFMIHFCAFMSLGELSVWYLVVPAFAKLGVCFICYQGQSIKKGLGSLWIDNCSLGIIGVNLGVVLVIAWVVTSGWCTLGGVVISLSVSYLLNKKVSKHLGGINGDVLGACGQYVEWGIILLLVFLQNR